MIADSLATCSLTRTTLTSLRRQPSLITFRARPAARPKTPPAKHHSVVCSCLSTVLPRNCDHGLPVLETAAVKYQRDKDSARRSVRAWNLDPPPRS